MGVHVVSCLLLLQMWLCCDRRSSPVPEGVSWSAASASITKSQYRVFRSLLVPYRLVKECYVSELSNEISILRYSTSMIKQEIIRYRRRADRHMLCS
ncbi:hypothetical protein BJX99DRAFT_228341 [Aspergillus californicus]